MFNLPKRFSGIGELTKFSDKYLAERQTYEPEEPDIMSHILAAGPFFPNKEHEKGLLETDARLLVVAGSDTTSAALTFAFYNIARDPKIIEGLRSELSDNNISNGPDLNVHSLKDLPYLNGVINETLRLHPPVPSGFFRDTPPEGVTMGGHFLPGGVTLLTPPLVIQRCKRSITTLSQYCD